MLIAFSCQHCQGKIEIDAAAIGSRIACPHCGKAIEVPRVRPGPGATVGGFKIQRLIGVGGMGEVYLARQLSLDRDVALKLFPPDLASDKDRVQRFLNEIRLLARLEHPNIVTAHEAGEDAGVLFMAMAYVNGEPLDKLLERAGPLPEKRALQIVRKIAGALAYAWNEHRLLHRDVKPSNILLDAHGEPKLADLGLSRTMDRRGSDTADDEIIGTPNYMSPEQVEGRDDIDCRSDMYALGATLYHILTGQLPFQAGSVMETLQKQLSEALPDPRVFNPAIGEPCVRLMEILLAKDPAHRHPTWESLMGDLDRVKAGKFPTRHPVLKVLKGGSVLLRAKDEAALAEIRKLRMTASDLQKLHRVSTASVSRKRREAFPWGSLIALASLLALAGFAVWGIAKLHREETRRAPMPISPPSDGERPPTLEERLTALRAEAEQNAGDDDDLLRRVESFRESARGTPWALEAVALLRDLRERRHALVQRAWNELRERAETAVERNGLDAGLRLMEESDAGVFAAEIEPLRREWAAEKLAARVEQMATASGFEAALQFVEQYDGPFAAALEARRQDWAAQQRARIAQRDAARAAAAQAAFETLRTEMCAAILARDAAAARAAVERARPLLAEEQRSAAAQMAAFAETAARLNEIVLDSFRADIGRAIPISFASGVETWEVLGVASGRVSLRRPAGLGSVERAAVPDDLSAVEKFRRVGNGNTPHIELLRGLIVLDAGRNDVARRHFEAMGEPLGPALSAYVELMEARRLDAAARRALEGALRIARQTLDDRPLEDIARAVRRAAYNTAEIAAIRAGVAAYRQTHASAAFTREAEPLLAALENVFTMPREVDRAVVDTALEALRRGNPPLERIHHTITLQPEGVQLVLVGNPGLTNLAALASLPLIRLNIAGGAVSDLSPLRGLPLKVLDLSGCPTADLSPLAGLPLTEANFEGCPIENIAPLKGAPLQDLNLRKTRVRSLAPLTGAPLRRLILDDAPVESLDPLIGAPLVELSARGCSKIASLAALQGMPLERLFLTAASISDLRPLRGLPLTELSLGSTGITEIGALKGLPLQSLVISHTRVNDLSPLAGMPLRRLEAVNLADLRSIEPLSTAPLTELWVSGTAVSDLRPLLERPLVLLDLRRCPVEDLTPLQELPIEVLYLDGCDQIRNYRVLLNLGRLTTLTISGDLDRFHFLRRHPTLRKIGENPDALRPVAEFLAR